MSVVAAVRTRVADGPNPDRGSTLVAAVVVGFIAMALGAVVVGSSISVSRDSGEDRQRTAQVHAAEAGIDRTYYDLQTGTTPCTPTTVDVGDQPDSTSVTTTVTYYNANGVNLGCPGTGVVPAKAVISAVSTSSNSVGPGAGTSRTMESEVLLSPSSGGTGYAIYSYSQFSVPNSFELVSDGVHAADIYARGGFNCTNSATIEGSVYSSQGGAQISNSCTVLGNVYVRDSINQTGNSSLGAALSSQGGLQIASNSKVVGDATVKTTVGGTRSSVKGSIREGQTIPDPTDQPLVYIGYDLASWQAAGFAADSQLGTTNCDGIKTRMLAATVPTIFYGNCAMNYSGNNSNLKLKTDVALFLTGGMTIANNFGMSSNDASQTRKLWVISPAGIGPEPAGWSPATCTGGGINFGNQTDFDQSINMFLYSCGSIQAANNSEFHGQIYGKQVTVSNAYSMTFVGLPPVGVDLGGAPALPGFNVEVVYKRETR